MTRAAIAAERPTIIPTGRTAGTRWRSRSAPTARAEVTARDIDWRGDGRLRRKLALKPPCPRGCGLQSMRSGGRVVEGARLKVIIRQKRIEGSNPSRSATLRTGRAHRIPLARDELQ